MEFLVNPTMNSIGNETCTCKGGSNYTICGSQSICNQCSSNCQSKNICLNCKNQTISI